MSTIDIDDATARGPGALSVREVVERVDELLEVTYRSGDLGNVSDVLSETVYVLLSLNTRESVYQRVFRTLREQYPRWSDVANAPTTELAGVLQPGGLQSQRANNLKAILARVRTDTAAARSPGSDLSLEFLRDLTDEEVERYLTSLPGVGVKTARCVMAYALDRHQLAVDTHVERILSRLGLARSTGSKTDHDAFQAVVPPRIRKRLHINLVHHGRAVCVTSSPKCEQCVLVSFCEIGRSTVGTRPGPVAIDLFGGAGGLGSGFREAGWRIGVAVEMDRNAAQSYRANNPGTPVLEGDVTTVSPDSLRSASPGLGEPQAVLAGPPCQGYSAAGSRNPDDPKNALFEHVIRIATELRSELIVIENVPGLERVNGVGFRDRILAALVRDHEAAKHELLASDFGVPQNRRRLFFLARRRDLGGAPTAPTASHSASPNSNLSPTPRVDELLRGDLEVPAGTVAEPLILADGTVIPNASTMTHSPGVVRKISKIPAGKGPI